MEEKKVHLLEEFVTEGSIYLIKGVKKENPSLLDTQITFEKGQSSIISKNNEENDQVKSKIKDSNKEIDNSDQCEKTLCNIKEERRDSDFSVDDTNFLHNEDEEKDPGDIFEKTSCYIKEERRDSDFSEDDKNVLHNKDEEKDPGDISENSSCNIKEEVLDSDFSEEFDEKDNDEAMFETKIEVEYHGVKYDDEDESGVTLEGDLSKTQDGDPLERKKYKCQHCPKAYLRERILNDHVIVKHGDSAQKKDYTCQHCDTLFVNVAAKKMHIRVVHEGFNINCPHCPNTFPDKYRLKQHVKQQHTEYKCKQCDEKFADRDSLTQHVKLKHKGFKHTCPHCPRAYSTPKTLRNHVESQHGDPMQLKKHICPQCGKIFASQTYLKTHIQTAHQGLKFPCPHCAKNFSTKGNLKNHLQISHGVQKKEFKCSFCRESFSKRSCLKQHTNIKHIDFKNRCPHCLKQFKTNFYLRCHVETQHGDPFQRKKNQCSLCDKSFVKSSYISKHMRIMHNGFKCGFPRCPEKFTTKDNLKLHVKNQHGEQGRS